MQSAMEVTHKTETTLLHKCDERKRQNFISRITRDCQTVSGAAPSWKSNSSIFQSFLGTDGSQMEINQANRADVAANQFCHEIETS
jgi:hypothetical protein